MLTRFVRNQLIIFTIASIVGVAVMVFTYMQVPTLLGVGKINVKLELPASGGLYRFSNVTYRGVEVGKVTSVDLTDTGALATMSLNTSPKIPADLQAEVRSISAVGEQYVDLVPRTKSGPYLQDGSIIAAKNTSIPQAVGPMLDQVSKLVDSIPKEKLGQLLDNSFAAFNGAGDDLQSLLDSSSKLAGDINGVSDQTRALIDDSGPLLEGQAQSSDAIRIWSRSLAGVTGQLATNDPQIRTILQTGPAAAQEVSKLLNQIKPTLPVLLTNMTTVGQVLVTYNASVEQLLVLLPPYVAAQQSYGLPTKNPTGLPMGEFAAISGDPPPCTIGFLPPSSWRSPADLSDIDTPDGLYCKLPQDSPIGVRGARNYPCMGKPGKRAPTVEICDSDLPYEPLAMRQHVTGPYPIDPNLVSQGVPPDDRTTFEEHIYGPLDGTPRPPGPAPAAPAPTEAPLAPAAAQLPPAPEGAVPPADTPPVDGGAAVVAPSSFDGAANAKPGVAVAQYDPKTGRYLTADGQLVQQSNLVSGAAVKTWKDLLPT